MTSTSLSDNFSVISALPSIYLHFMILFMPVNKLTKKLILMRFYVFDMKRSQPNGRKRKRKSINNGDYRKRAQIDRKIKRRRKIHIKVVSSKSLSCNLLISILQN